ncbi:MAG: type II pantothenate kinase [Ruminococcaceae bacterium]|nr:type II pantothenate kinase [Oscillospiraceae bacterium]
MSTVIGIDVGGSTTKIVGIRHEAGKKAELITPQFVRANDPITSIYGAFGKFTSENGLELSDIDRVMMTGVGSSFVKSPIYGLDCRSVSEFECAGRGGLYLSGLDDAIVVSMGTGTALIRARREGEKTDISYLGGTGVGGGTIIGLSEKLIGVETIEHIVSLSEGGDLSKIDLRISDISNSKVLPGINTNLTASNFGNVSDLADKHDLALGVVNMVAETIAMMAIFAARGNGIKDIVLTGNLATMSPICEVFAALRNSFNVHFTIPQNAQFATVIGAALNAEI